jgi:hypothetical protein
MSTQTLTINYRAPQPLIDPYWIRIEQDVVDDAATVTDTAAVLDALYQIEPCNQETSAPAPAAPVEQESVVDTVATVLDLPACDVEPDGSVQTTLRIYRSHLAEPYTLRLQGGTVIETVQESGSVTTTMEIAETVTIDYPVVSGFTCTPAPLSSQGNTLRFSEELVGRQLSASYHSQWDMVTVRITGVDGEPGECRALAFHHGIVDAIDLEIPEIAELDRSLCPAHRWNFDPADYEVTCYKIIEVTQRCTCSGDEVGSYTTEQVVPCPNTEMRCPNNQTTCMHLVGTEPLDEWVECAGDSEIPGRPGQNYALSTPDYYQERCCRQPSVALPQCPTKRTVYKAELPIEYGQAYWRDLYGDATRFIPVPPPAGICGEWIIEQRIDSSDCCDGVPVLVWDESVSPEVMAPSSAEIIGVTGGRPPYTWDVEGTGFQFSNGRQTIETDAATVRLSALTSACGPAMITVTDGCSEVIGWILCTAGEWELVGSFNAYELYVNAHIADFVPYTVSGYFNTVDNRQRRGMYCLSSNDPNYNPTDEWTYSTWALANGQHYVACSSHNGATIIDPVVGLFTVPVINNVHEVGGQDVCGGTPFATVFSHFGVNTLHVWRWSC